MDSSKMTVVRLWFKKAESDIKTIENNIKSKEPPTDTICFHAQQAIEKYVKGALVYFGEHVTKTHDLISLLTQISKHIPELASFENELDEISHYGVEVRYPDILYEPTLEEAQSAYETALKIKDIVLAKIE
ncbi:MAG: HEPN domain-containing protein [Candidatus Omnitrophota bacterium]